MTPSDTESTGISLLRAADEWSTFIRRNPDYQGEPIVEKDLESGLRAAHKPLPDGRCEHRWRNRQTKIVRCSFADGWRAALAAHPPSAAMAPEPVPAPTNYGLYQPFESSGALSEAAHPPSAAAAESVDRLVVLFGSFPTPDGRRVPVEVIPYKGESSDDYVEHRLRVSWAIIAALGPGAAHPPAGVGPGLDVERLREAAVETLTPWYGSMSQDPEDGYLRRCIDVQCLGHSTVVPTTDEDVVVQHKPGCAVAEFFRRATPERDAAE